MNYKMPFISGWIKRLLCLYLAGKICDISMKVAGKICTINIKVAGKICTVNMKVAGEICIIVITEGWRVCRCIWQCFMRPFYYFLLRFDREFLLF